MTAKGTSTRLAGDGPLVAAGLKEEEGADGCCGGVDDGDEKEASASASAAATTTPLDDFVDHDDDDGGDGNDLLWRFPRVGASERASFDPEDDGLRPRHLQMKNPARLGDRQATGTTKDWSCLSRRRRRTSPWWRLDHDNNGDDDVVDAGDALDAPGRAVALIVYANL